MIRSITQFKPEEELKRLLGGLSRIFIVGCGTCSTLTHTGGEKEVRIMKETLTEKGKTITGTLIAPVACDNIMPESLSQYQGPIKQADVILVMSCGYGVQNLARQLSKMVVPALDTLFIGKESVGGQFDEVCIQCGQCILGETGGICPVTSCHKGLVNGPCGGTDNGKCEIDKQIDCAWTSIYTRLFKMDKLESMKKYQKLRNHNESPSPGKFILGD